VHQAPGELDVGTGHHRGVEVGVPEHEPIAWTQHPVHLSEHGVRIW
jgi:hypothetical protein